MHVSRPFCLRLLPTAIFLYLLPTLSHAYGRGSGGGGNTWLFIGLLIFGVLAYQFRTHIHALMWVIVLVLFPAGLGISAILDGHWGGLALVGFAAVVANFWYRAISKK